MLSKNNNLDCIKNNNFCLCKTLYAEGEDFTVHVGLLPKINKNFYKLIVKRYKPSGNMSKDFNRHLTKEEIQITNINKYEKVLNCIGHQINTN